VLKAFVDSGAAAEARQAIVCEPTSCRMATRHRGVLAFIARLAGQGAHSSLADRLPAPLVDIARAAVALRDWALARKDPGPPGFEGLCRNIAGLHGGVASNVVPKEVRPTLSLRPPPGADQKGLTREVFDLIERHARGASIETVLDNPPFATRSPESFRNLLG